MKRIPFKFFKLICFVMLLPFVTTAQKLPNKQEVSVRIPTGVKIDGNANEWNDQFQAFNKTTEIFYTIANDDNNLYLIVHATKSSIIEKMIEGGIGFTISQSGKKNSGKNVTVLFPLMPMTKCQDILLSAGKKLNAGNYTLSKPDPGDTVYKTKLASSINKANGWLTENMKEIKVSGIDGIVDTIPDVNRETPYFRLLPLRDHPFKIIPISNEDHIRASTRFTDQGDYTYEMSIPIKYLGFDNIQKFNYTITIHGRGEDNRVHDTIWYGHLNGYKEILYMDLENATEFSGEYTLAKKP